MPIDVKALARLGAETRIQELSAEIEEIRRAFPGVGGAQRGRPRASTKAAPRKRKRKPMSAAQKKAVGERMKKYWAGRRKEAAKKG